MQVESPAGACPTIVSLLNAQLLSVARYLKKQLRVCNGYHLFLAYTFAFMMAPAGIAQTGNIVFRHGTLIVIDYTSACLIVAADSRLSDFHDGRAINRTDTDCKIVILGDSSLFFSMGASQAFKREGSKIAVVYDTDDVARRSYRVIAATNHGHVRIRDIAEKWGSEMKRCYRAAYSASGEDFLAGNLHNDLGYGGFAGIEDGKPVLYLVTISFSIVDGEEGIRVIDTVKRWQPHDSAPIFSFGLSEYVIEFFHGTSQRARERGIFVESQIKRLHLGGLHRRAYILKSLAESEIAWSRNPQIGTPVAVVILQPAHAPRWFAPGACNAAAHGK